MTISMIVAMDLNNAIGVDNGLLCTLKDDMKHFKETTMNKTVIMGRKTFDSIGKELPNRVNVILTKDKLKTNDFDKGVVFVDSIAVVLNLDFINPDTEYIIIGGQSIYKQFLPFTDKLYITTIQNEFENADAYFPCVDWSEWKQLDMSIQEQDERNEYEFVVETLVRK